MYDRGARLRELREQKGLSIPKLATKLGVSKSTVERHENNTSVPSADHIEILALLYGVTADYLLGLDNKKRILIDGLSAENEALVMQLITRLVKESKE